MTWYLEPGETLLFHGIVDYATGRASKVKDRRWFRDEQGRDIGAELPGWPPAPVHELRGGKASAAGKTFGFLGKATLAVVNIAVDALGGTGGVADIQGSDGAKPADPALEVEDFPVLFAPAGTVARTWPWQLDPDRQPEDYRCYLHLTDRRLLVVGGPFAEEPNEVLWQGPLTLVGGVQRHDFSTVRGADVTIGFTDDSWVRLDLGGRGWAAKVAWVLSGNTVPVELTPEQDAWAAGLTRLLKGTRETVGSPVPGAPPGTLLIQSIMNKPGGYFLRTDAVTVHADGTVAAEPTY